MIFMPVLRNNYQRRSVLGLASRASRASSSAWKKNKKRAGVALVAGSLLLGGGAVAHKGYKITSAHTQRVEQVSKYLEKNHIPASRAWAREMTPFFNPTKPVAPLSVPAMQFIGAHAENIAGYEGSKVSPSHLKRVMEAIAGNEPSARADPKGYLRQLDYEIAHGSSIRTKPRENIREILEGFYDLPVAEQRKVLEFANKGITYVPVKKF
ncbi:MAG: hypothetical protein NTY48_02045 [Candidatus Diapherotrites archaeon]|nr:hypothetical protein [Candidatus Diapherotrites archaeon]